MIPVCWVEGGPTTWWDQAFLEGLLDGSVWRTAAPWQFQHTTGLDALRGSDGAVVIIPGQHSLGHVDAVSRALRRLDWALIVVGGDEEALYPVETLKHPNLRLWVQTPRPGRHGMADRRLPVGWTPQTPRLLPLTGLEAQDRPYDLFFSGQVPDDHPPRLSCVNILRELSTRYQVELAPTQRFAQQYDEGETEDERALAYLRRLASTKIAPAPSGPVTPDTFRCWESLEAGALPVVNATAPYAKNVTGYWPYLFDESPPWPILEDWKAFPSILPRILNDWPGNASRASAWWQQQKRAMAYWLYDDLRALTGKQPDSMTVADKLTVLIPTSPIPSHPGLGIISETIATIQTRLPGCEILILIDGIRHEQQHLAGQYEEYVRSLLWHCEHVWLNTVPLLFDTHQHQSGMTRRALDLVRTPAILFVEHDTPLCGSSDFAGILRVIASGKAHTVRLHHSTEIYPEHEHLMLDASPQNVDGVPLLRTIQWSQRPHVSSTDFYRKMMNKYFTADEKWMIEDRLHSVVSVAWDERKHAGWNEFRLWTYAPSGSLERSYHLDGRKSQPKWVDS